MKENDVKILNSGGIDVADALSRLNGSEKLFTKVLTKFLNDTNYKSYVDYMQKGDIENAERSMHALKGIAGNLGITNLYKLSAEIDAMLKEGKTPDERQSADLNRAYEIAITAIKDVDCTPK